MVIRIANQDPQLKGTRRLGIQWVSRIWIILCLQMSDMIRTRQGARWKGEDSFFGD